jgi:hypothetical protein
LEIIEKEQRACFSRERGAKSRELVLSSFRFYGVEGEAESKK